MFGVFRWRKETKINGCPYTLRSQLLARCVGGNLESGAKSLELSFFVFTFSSFFLMIDGRPSCGSISSVTC